MKKYQLGCSEVEVSPMIFGGNVFGWTADRTCSFELLDRFVDRGFDTIDTADVYSAWAPGLEGGESETVLGEWLARRGRRDDIVLMSKVGMWEKRKGLSSGNIEVAVEDSLRRLRTEYLDVCFAHIDDQDVPLDETLGAFAKLVESGKVRAIGASNYTADRLNEALGISQSQGLPRYEVTQPLYNLYDRQEFESELADLVSEKRLGVVSYFSLASGFLTGKYRSFDDVKGNPREEFLKGYFDERGQRLLEEIFRASEEIEASPSQVALAWLMARKHVTAPIVSATTLAQLDELLDSCSLSVPDVVMGRLDINSK
ncbi:aldo/keto reductase [Halomonas sp.]|uniref:aldo/keto reductase n=1 Tax=Halomonas sp. TaxID=1486246 RepID=UPI00298EA0D7|nr:aldo/keto reductase [Halomonas sp.]MDW7745680.1 aldo/keto reductase [Halomonas sp.]